MMNLVHIPAGSYSMGSPLNEQGRNRDEGPMTHITFTQGFWMGQTEVTQKQFHDVMGYNPSVFTGDMKLPVDNVPFAAAVEFCNRMTNRFLRESFVMENGRRISLVFRLPTEAQWEYACRAGTRTPFSGGNTIPPTLANYNGNYSYQRGPKGIYRGKTTLVKAFPPNK